MAKEEKEENLVSKGRYFYIRYRIYVQKANESQRRYVSRLTQSLKNLGKNINKDKAYKERDYTSEEITYKTYYPENLKNINSKYYYIISHICTFFDCLAIWEKKVIKGSQNTINTFTVIGYNTDMLLAFHYTTKIIHNLECMRFNLRREYRRVKINRRRRGENTLEKCNAMQKSSRFFYKSLDKLGGVTKELLAKKVINQDKRKTVFKKLLVVKSLDIKKYHFKGEPKIIYATSRNGKFQNKRLILVNY